MFAGRLRTPVLEQEPMAGYLERIGSDDAVKLVRLTPHLSALGPSEEARSPWLGKRPGAHGLRPPHKSIAAERIENQTAFMVGCSVPAYGVLKAAPAGSPGSPPLRLPYSSVEQRASRHSGSSVGESTHRE